MEEMALLDAFVIHVLSNDPFLKHSAAYDRLVMNADTDNSSRNGINRCICNMKFFKHTFWKIFNGK